LAGAKKPWERLDVKRPRQFAALALKGFLSMLSARRIESLLLVSLGVFSAVMSYLTVVKYYTFHVTGWDLGVFSQSLYTTLNSHGFFVNNLEMGSHFHVHFQPILILCLPVFAICQNPVTLLILQAIVVALGAVPLYLLTIRELENKTYGLALSILYLLYPALYGACFFDFHPEAFTPLLGFTVLYFFRGKRWGAYFASLVLLLSVKEDMAIIAVSIGLYGLATELKSLLKKKINRKAIMSVATVALGVIWLFSSLYAVSWFVRSEGYSELWNSGYTHHTGNVYGNLGGEGGVMGVISSLLRDPVKIFTQLAYLPSEKLAFFATLFLPVCMLAFLDFPAVLLFLPTLLEFTLASNPSYFSILYHYPFQLTPLIFVAAVYGIKKLSAGYAGFPSRKEIVRPVLCIMLVGSLVTLFLTVPIIVNWWGAPLTVDDGNWARNRLVSLIPLAENPSVLTQSNYFPHVSASAYSYAYWNITKVDYILIDVSSNWYSHHDPAPAEYVAKFGEQTAPFAERIGNYLQSGEFGLLGQVETALLYKRGYSGNPAIFIPYTIEPLDWQRLSSKATIVEDPTSASGRVLLHRANDGNGTTFWFGPYLQLPPGKYKAEFRMKLSNLVDAYVLTLDVTANSGKDMLARSILTTGNFSKADAWQEFILTFVLQKPALSVELRGTQVSNATDVYLDRVTVTQLSLPN
jgi:uncharacterized membrane protein